MTDKQKMIKTRDEYIDLVKKELMGPGSEISIPDEEHELISDAPKYEIFCRCSFYSEYQNEC